LPFAPHWLNFLSVRIEDSTVIANINIHNERTEMSSQGPTSDTDREQTMLDGAEGDNDAVANKLSKELSNWRRRRTNSRPKREEGERVNYQTESARTIKLRGHETLVVRKPKLLKPAANQRPD
jgi:hypothetical protein